MESVVVDTLRQFARYMGMELSVPDNGVFCFQFERSGTLFIELVGDKVVVYLLRRIDSHSQSWRQRALSLCHYKNVGFPYPVSAGVRGDCLAFITRIPVREFDLTKLEGAFGILREAHEKLWED